MNFSDREESPFHLIIKIFVWHWNVTKKATKKVPENEDVFLKWGVHRLDFKPSFMVFVPSQPSK